MNGRKHQTNKQFYISSWEKVKPVKKLCKYSKHIVQYITHKTKHLNTVLCINNNPEKSPILVPVLLSIEIHETCRQLHRRQCNFSSLYPPLKPQMKLSIAGANERSPAQAHQRSHLKVPFIESVTENKSAVFLNL